MLPVGKRYTTTVTKSIMKNLVCENCHKEYQHEVTRKAQGFGDSLLWLDNKGAEERSARFANRNCDKSLARAVPMEPCPHCGWHQKRVVNIGKRRRLLYTALAGFVVACMFACFTRGFLRCSSLF